MAHNISSKPLFYYLATQVAHDPLQVPPKYTARPASTVRVPLFASAHS